MFASASFCFFYYMISLFHHNVGKGPACRPHQIFRIHFDLGAAPSAADHNSWKLLRALVQHRRNLLLHTNAGAAAPDVAGQLRQFL